MSVDYLPEKKISYNEVMNLAIAGITIQEAKDPPHPLEEACVLTDGKDYLWAYAMKNGGSSFTAFGSNNPDNILELLSAHFKTDFVSEYDDKFHELVDSQYREDFITIQFPTDENPGPWTKVWPPSENRGGQ